MRLSAYKKAIDQARELPMEIPELIKYFHDGYDPRMEAINRILNNARRDIDGLFHGELEQLFQYSRIIPASNNKD